MSSPQSKPEVDFQAGEPPAELVSRDLTVGDGDEAKPGDRVEVHYVGVEFDTGEAFVVEGLALVGRRPEARSGEPVRHVVPLRSADMSLSKTHAQFQVAPDGALTAVQPAGEQVRVTVSVEVSPLGPLPLRTRVSAEAVAQREPGGAP